MKKRYLFILFILPVLFLLFGASPDRKIYYTKTTEEVYFSTKPAFFGKFLKPKTFSKPGKQEITLRCFLRKLKYDVFVLDFDERSLVLNKGEKYSPDTSHLTPNTKISSDIPIKEITNNPGIHEINIYDHGVSFKKTISVVGFQDDMIYMKKGEKKNLDFGISGDWTVKGDSVIVHSNGSAEAVKTGDSTISFSCEGKKASLNIKVIDMKSLYWLSPGESFRLPDKKGTLFAGDIIKVKEDKVKAIKCGKANYKYMIGDVSFEGEILITDFPKEKAMLKGTEFHINDIDFISSDSEIAEVKENTVIAKENGNCTIIASYENEKKICQLTVFSIEPKKIIGNAGQEFDLPNIEGMTFSSEDENIVKTEERKAILIGGGASNILYEYQGQKGKIPVYSSSYENGDATGKVIKVGEDGIVHRMTVWCQHARNYSKYNTFLAGNGCSLCSLTCILNGYAKGYEDKSPPEVMDTIEKQVIGENEWCDHHHNGRDGSAMPMTLNGINLCMMDAGVHTDYIYSFDRESMKEDIINHLSIGQPVVIEVSKTNQITGKTDKYWSSSVHTVVLVGLNGENVIVADPANVSRGSGRGRIKETTLDFISQYMWSCDKEPNHFYWAGKGEGGGYIKVFSQQCPN